MGVFKEEIHFLEDLQKRQSRVWVDSCDVGVSAHKVDLNRARQVVKTLLELPGSEVEFKQNRPAIQRQYKLVVMWGRADDGWYDATVCNLLYFQDRKVSFFSITRLGHILTDKNGKEMGS